MRIKAKDVARELGLSTATVSLAMNNRPGVNEETRRRVLEYMERAAGEKAGYHAGKEGIIRLLSFLEDRSYWDSSEHTRTLATFECASRLAREKGYKVELVSVVQGRDDFAQVLAECERDQVAGVFLGAAYMTADDYTGFWNFNIPFIVCDQDFGDLRTDNIILNNHQGVTWGLEYLYEHGHRDILYFRNSNSFYNMYERREAFKRFMDKHNLQERQDEKIVNIGGDTQAAYEGMLSYLKEGKHIPTAIFSENFEVTIGVSRALESRGFKIPEDISIVGFDSIPDMALMDFEPTCIRCLHERKAGIAISRLIDRIEGRVRESVKIYVNTELVIGNSVRRYQMG